MNWHSDYTAELNEKNDSLLFGFKSLKQLPGMFLLYSELHIQYDSNLSLCPNH